MKSAFKYFALVLGLLALCSGHDAAADVKQLPDWGSPQYLGCVSDEDCASVEACGTLSAINRDHQAEMQSFYDEMRHGRACAGGRGSADLAPACRNNICVMLPLRGADRDDADYCEHNDECVVVTGSCGQKAVVNHSHAAEAQSRLGPVSGGACDEFDGRQAHNLRCEQHHCAADLR